MSVPNPWAGTNVIAEYVLVKSRSFPVRKALIKTSSGRSPRHSRLVGTASSKRQYWDAAPRPRIRFEVGQQDGLASIYCQVK